MTTIMFCSCVALPCDLCFSVFSKDNLSLLTKMLQQQQPFNGPLSGTTQVSRYQKGKTNLDFTQARDSGWQWHQLGICKSAPHHRQIPVPAAPSINFLQAGCPSCCITNSTKALKEY